MILGISHLAVRSADLESDSRLLESQGWATAFVDHEVRVHEFERPFLSPGHPACQSLVLLRHPAGVPALELVAPVSAAAAKAQRTQLDLAGAGKGILHGTIRVPDLPGTLALFVDVLGFRPAGTSVPGCASISLSRPLPQWSMALTIEEEPAAGKGPTLDGRGWFVLALLSSDLRADAERLHEHRHNVRAITEPFATRVSQKEWTIVLCILQSGFGIELLQLSTDRAS